HRVRDAHLTANSDTSGTLLPMGEYLDQNQKVLTDGMARQSETGKQISSYRFGTTRRSLSLCLFDCRDRIHEPPQNPAGSSMNTGWSHLARLLCGLRQESESVDEYVERLLDVAENGVFGEEELAVLFNSGLRNPLSRAEMRVLSPLDFDAVWLSAAERSESTVSTSARYPSPLVTIPEGGSLQIGVVGIATPSPSLSAASPPSTSLVVKRGRRASWGSTSEESQPEPAVPHTSFHHPTTSRPASSPVVQPESSPVVQPGDPALSSRPSSRRQALSSRPSSRRQALSSRPSSRRQALSSRPSSRSLGNSQGQRLSPPGLSPQNPPGLRALERSRGIRLCLP
ncbi:hypothetical protein IRJ41_019461, partial [Triplophysa rosa]